jgi:long-chain fatty acid transport protein
MVNKIVKEILFLIIISNMFCSSGYSAGFLNYNQDAAAVGMANSFTAIADNGSAVFYNPAGINQLEGTQLRSGFYLIFPNTSFRGAESGERTDMETDFAALMTGYITHKVNDKVSIGGGIFTPFGMVTEWPSGWEGKTVATYSDMRTFCVNPVVSVQVHPRLSLAVGIDYLYSDFKVRQVIDPNQMIGLPLGIPHGKVTLDGFDDTWGYNLGLLFHINDRWKLGVAYRSKLKLEFDGHAHYHLPPFLQALYPPTDISPRVELPPMVSVEVSAQMWNKWTFATGFLWTGWSVYDELAPKFRDNLLVPPDMRSSPQGWKDVFAFHFGVQYQFNPTWVVRGGYIFDQSPVPEHTLGPMVPDSDDHLFSFGIGYARNRFTIDMASMILFFEDRHTRRNIDGLNGKYTSTIVTFLMSFTYAF